MEAQHIDRSLKQIKKKLPIQNPLYAFVHNNSLIEFEDRYFFEALESAAMLYGARPYFSVKEYRAILKEDLSDCVVNEAKKVEFERIQKGKVSRITTKTHLRNHQVWERIFREEFTREVHDLLIPLLANYLDQGTSHWANPWKKEGFWKFFNEYCENSWSNKNWRQILKGSLLEYRNEEDLRKIVLKEFEKTGNSDSDLDQFLLELCFDLRGWSGMIGKLEDNPALAPIKPVKANLLEYLTIRILVENALNQFLCKKHHQTSKTIQELKSPVHYDFSENRIFQEVLERTHRDRFERAYFQKRKTGPLPIRSGCQIVFCIDDREESIRRNLEKLDPQVRTYGIVGYYGVDMLFFPVNRAKPTRQVPPVIEPQHKVYEVPIHQHRSAAFHIQFQSNYAKTVLQAYYQTRLAISGFFHSLLLGFLSFFPLVSRILFPRIYHVFDSQMKSYMREKIQTRYEIQGDQGYSIEQMAEVVKTVLSFGGMKKDFSSLVFIIGHGSTTSNNPFKQAYGCGACSGNAGFPNSRVFCQMANRPDVRTVLAEKGYLIPDSTLFVPGFHDTCSDDIHYELSGLSFSIEQKQAFDDIKIKMKNAASLNSLERVQFFKDVKLPDSKKYASVHVKARSMDLAQPRPELGHSRVSLCVLGRRELTQGIDLDRRAFLVSYDPTQDPDGTLLEEVAMSAVPVCANITLDYFFSRVDNNGFGAGSKLPLNITSLLGVMKGSKSDLLIGLGSQMVELHEPVRVFVVLEAQVAHIDRLIQKNVKLRNLVVNRWILLGRICPDTGDLFYLDELSGWEKVVEK